MASDLIGCRCRYGRGTFVITNSEKNKKKLTTIFGGMMNILKDINIGNKIIVGRKQLSDQPGIFLLKHKKKYTIDCVGDIKNNYISIPIP